MKVVALVSGGKDSCYNMMKCVEYGHEIACIANLAPPDRTVRMWPKYYLTQQRGARQLDVPDSWSQRDSINC